MGEPLEGAAVPGEQARPRRAGPPPPPAVEKLEGEPAGASAQWGPRPHHVPRRTLWCGCSRCRGGPAGWGSGQAGRGPGGRGRKQAPPAQDPGPADLSALESVPAIRPHPEAHPLRLAPLGPHWVVTDASIACFKWTLSRGPRVARAGAAALASGLGWAGRRCAEATGGAVPGPSSRTGAATPAPPPGTHPQVATGDFP